MYGLGGDCFLASPRDGIVSFQPTSYELRHSYDRFSEITVSGIILEGDFSREKKDLSEVPMIDLLAEVDRRIKSGDNITKG